MDAIKPSTHGQFDFVLNKHAPIMEWESSVGDIQKIKLSHRSIKVDVEVGIDEAARDNTWAPSDRRVMVAVEDCEGCPVFEHPVTFDEHDNIKEVTVGLRSI